MLEFALSGDATGVEPLNLPAANMLATLDTHDSATIVAWWRQLDTKSQTSITTMLQRRELLATGASDEVAVATALLHLLAASDAHVVIATLEDLWGEQLPQNVPGTTGPDQANWRRRCKVGLEHFASNPDLNGALRRTDTLRRTSVKVADDPSQSTPSLVRAPMITQADPSFRERR